MPAQPLIGQSLTGEVKTEYPTPNPVDEILVAQLESKIDDYVSLLMGTPPPQGVHPEQMLTQQIPIDWSHVQRTYAKDRTLQQTYNASISYVSEGDAYPIFSRDYIVRRYNYVPLTKAAPLSGLVTATVTAGGAWDGTSAISVSLSGGTGSGGAVTAIVSGGAVVHLAITAEGSYTVAPSLTINGVSGATGTCAVQPQTAVLVKEDLLRTPDSPLDGLWVLVRRIYQTVPGPILTKLTVSQDVRGRTIETTSQTGLVGTLPPETGSLVVSSSETPQDTVLETRVTSKMESLPPDETWSDWQFVSLPLLLFDIVNTIFCNGSSFFTVVTNPVVGGGSSVLRKHRYTVSYHTSVPNPDLSASSFTTKIVQYAGKVIRFSYDNVLCDHVSYDGDFAQSDADFACGWTEAYDFPATTPSATDFAAGDWYVRSYKVEQYGVSMWKSTLTEFYSASGNPSI